MKQPVKTWNLYLSFISIFNIIFFNVYYFSKRNTYDLFQHKLAILVFIYIYVCAYRSIWPRIEGPNICLNKNSMSLPILGRTSATIAEISFGLLFVLITNKLILGISKKNMFMLAWNNILFYLIVLAQVFCWIGIITTDPSYNALEESLWTVFGISKIILYIIIYYYIGFNNSYLRYTIPIIIVCVLVYTLFMITVDVPMYIQNAKTHNGKYNSLGDGILKLCKCNFTKKLDKWKEDIPWLSGYFTFAVWFSIGLFIFYENYKKR
jgi:hypothetical protein